MTNIQLEDELVLRSATMADVEKVARFNETVMAEPPEMTPEPEIAEWTRDLFDGVNRNVGPSDFTVVEDTKTGEIVSSIVLISQIWNIGGIDTPMGMPEIVGTHPEYRRRGLVRRQFEVMHEWSKQRGQFFNTVMGIPYYYKQFGYEYALDAWGGRTTSLAMLEGVLEKKDDRPPFTVRDAKREDIPFIVQTERTSRDRLFVTAARDTETFEREMFNRREGSAIFYRTRIFEREGVPVGYFEYHFSPKNDMLVVDAFEISAEANWFDATTTLLVDLKSLADQARTKDGEQCEKIEFETGPEHPGFKMFDRQFGDVKRAYAWVVRVPDIARLVSHLSPLIESRLADSDLRGWSGDLKISFYTSGLQMDFAKGALKSVVNTGPIERHEAHAHYPDLTFTKALFGQYSFTQLRDMYSDCFAHKRAQHVLQDILWGGQQTSAVLPTN
jgi:predicted N-acetyltransferase YhbS